MLSLFNSTRKFVLADALVSHGQLLLRASKIDGNKSNIDIIFSSSEYINIPTVLFGINLIQHNNIDISLDVFNSDAIEFINKFTKYFEIKTNGKSYCIIASSFKIFENELALNETSLGVFQCKGREKLISASI